MSLNTYNMWMGRTAANERLWKESCISTWLAADPCWRSTRLQAVDTVYWWNMYKPLRHKVVYFWVTSNMFSIFGNYLLCSKFEDQFNECNLVSTCADDLFCVEQRSLASDLTCTRHWMSKMEKNKPVSEILYKDKRNTSVISSGCPSMQDVWEFSLKSQATPSPRRIVWLSATAIFFPPVAATASGSFWVQNGRSFEWLMTFPAHSGCIYRNLPKDPLRV